MKRVGYFTVVTLGMMAKTALGTLALAAEEGSSFLDPQYGDLFVAEVIEPSKGRPWQVSASYSFEFSNPYFAVHGLQIGASHSIWDGILAPGFQASILGTRETDLLKIVSSEVESLGLLQRVEKPAYSGYATLALRPWLGRLSLFNRAPMVLEISMIAGAGGIQYEADPLLKTKGGFRPALMYQVRPQFFLNKAVGISLGLGQEWESPWSSQKRLAHTVGHFGLVARF